MKGIVVFFLDLLASFFKVFEENKEDHEFAVGARGVYLKPTGSHDTNPFTNGRQPKEK